MRPAILVALVLLLCDTFASDPTLATETPGDSASIRAMWVWRTDLLLDFAQERETFLEDAGLLGLTDVYLFLRADDYFDRDGELQRLLGSLADAGIRAWGMEGWRGYFSDVEGPGGLYAAVDALLAFNARNDVAFVGFHSDLEPQDGQGEGRIRFFDGIPASALSPSQEVIREELLSEWIATHENLRARADIGGILYGAAFPSWLDDYYGEALTIASDGSRRSILAHLMPLVTQHVVMSYNTNPKSVIERVRGELDYGDTLGERRVMFSVEVHPGPGKNISFADTPGVSSREAVLAHIAAIEAETRQRPSYLGWSIHDWRGWAQLPR